MLVVERRRRELAAQQQHRQHDDGDQRSEDREVAAAGAAEIAEQELLDRMVSAGARDEQHADRHPHRPQHPMTAS
ncbi:MAG: hypothetical protein R2862_11970 [Thermoanaerobaculia bacterium]